MSREILKAFSHGELLLHHRAGGSKTPITCGAPHGCITAVVEDVQCRSCLDVLAANGAAPSGVCHCLGGGCFDCRPDTGPPAGALTDDDLDGSPDQFTRVSAPNPGGAE